MSFFKLNKRHNNIESAVQSFINNNSDPSLSLNFYRVNGQVLLQLFKVANILNWDEKFSLPEKSGQILVVSFHKDKTDNDVNRIRFNQSTWRSEFCAMSSKMGDSYYYHLGSSVAYEEAFNKIENMLFDIYGELQNIKFELAIW